jgi:hypothetical protein
MQPETRRFQATRVNCIQLVQPPAGCCSLASWRQPAGSHTQTCGVRPTCPEATRSRAEEIVRHST